jgi:hypothetical protein
MNTSKKTDPRQWRKWRLSGACGPQSRKDELESIGSELTNYNMDFQLGLPYDEEHRSFLAKLFRNHC